MLFDKFRQTFCPLSKNCSIVKKTFIVTFLSILVSFFLLYLMIYSFFPLLYTQVKIAKTEAMVAKFDKKLKSGMSLEDAVQDVTKNTSSLMVVYDESYEEPIFCSYEAFCNLNNLIDIKYLLQDQDLVYVSDKQISKIRHLDPEKEVSVAFIKNFLQKENLIYLVEHPIVYQGQTYNIDLVTLLHPFGIFKNTMSILIPYTILITFLISVLFSFLNARYLTRPLLILNNKAAELAKLNFDNGIVIESNDELGELSRNLDIVSDNLKLTLSKLESDIEANKRREQDRLMYMSAVSHELKTPLTILKGQSECMIENIGVYKDHNYYLRENVKIIEDLEKLVNDVLLSTKFDDFEMLVNNEEIHADELICDVLSRLDMIIAEKRLVIKANIRNTIITADMKIMTAVIKNIIENAIKYSDPETQIIVELYDRKLLIKNYSELIKDADITTLVTPFKTLDTSRNKKVSGHGLGLYIIKRGIELNGYTFNIKNEGPEVSFILDFNHKINIHTGEYIE